MLVTILLLITTTGIGISKHYCGNTLVSVNFHKEAGSCCGEGSDCCHNEDQFYQVKDDFSVPQISNAPALAEIDILNSEIWNELFTASLEPDNFILIYSDSPPPPLIQTTLSSLQTYRL